MAGQSKKIIRFLLIQNSNPWKTLFYMCGGCGHAIKLSDVEEHAKEVHKADGVELFEVAGEANG